ncbi:hypothetical protein ACIQZG_02450 [Lysinibacillus sp. NPDC096418]|uniref:hypothetical protein n=1 Tax=Lysinibacillus sp. NPDC096418 TaxID=3364138 RepID=UPI00381A098B
MSQQYYLLSIKYSNGKNTVTWWGPNNSGYTDDIEKAGIYSEEQIQKQSFYYSNKGVMPVPVEKVQAATKRVVVLNETENTKLFGIHEHLKTAKEY